MENNILLQNDFLFKIQKPNQHLTCTALLQLQLCKIGGHRINFNNILMPFPIRLDI